MKKIAIFLSMLLFMGNLVVNAQTKTITGQVVSSEDEMPIPGVSVAVKGTTLGTVTDIDGNFELKVPEDAKELIVSFVGMKNQTVILTEATSYSISMEPDLVGIDEVVVTAIGIERSAREVGYSMSKVDEETLTMAKSPTLATGLQGKVAGLQISTTSTGVNPDQRVTLRGNRSFTGNNQALLVLDGVPVSLSYLTSLNPNDVQDISILKGANASALYGSDAANGVIMVTTKQGSKQNIQIQFSNSTTFDKLAYLPEMQNRFGSGSSSDAYGNPVYESYENQQYGHEFDGEPIMIGVYDEYGNFQEVPYSPISGEKEAFFNTGLTMQNDLSFSAGDDKGSFFISLQDAVVKGLIPKDELRRDAVRFNGTRKYKGFTARANVNFTHIEDDVTVDNVLWSVYNTAQHIPLTSYSDWRPLSTPEWTNWADINHYYNAYYDNPYTQIDKDRRKRRRDQLIGTLDLSQQITPWLKATARTSMNLMTNVWKTTYEAWDFSDWAIHDSGRSISGDIKADVQDGSTLSWRWTNDFLLTVDHTFGDFSLNAIAGASTRSTYYNYLRTDVSELEVPGVYNLRNRLGELTGDQYYTETRRWGVFGDLTLGYKEFLFLHASGRNDWDSRLDPSNWSFFYPGVDVSFIFTEAIPGLKDNSVLSYGKIRGGIAKVGSINISPYDLENTFGVTGGFPYGSLTAHSISNSLKNRYLEPEFTLSKEIGLDLNFLESRVNLEATYYTMSTTNQTLPAEIAYSSGYSNMNVNSGEMKNSGLELELGLVPVSTNDLRWDVNVSYAYLKSEVVSLTDAFDELYLGNNFVYAIVGESYPVNKASDFDRVMDESSPYYGRVIVDASTGMPTKSTDLHITGQTTPKHIVGVQTYLRWNGFTAGLSAEYRGGHVMRSGLGNDMMFPGIDAVSASAGRERFVYPNSVINVGTADNPEYVENTNITTIEGNVDFWTQTYRNISRPFVVNAAFLKIREVSLYYDVPGSFLNNYTGEFIKGIRAGFIGRNLWTWLPESNVYGDPEANNGSGNEVGYSPAGAIPPTKSYGFNLTVTF
ncbi:SusC/RagA family TonB-linked outer membrane protein [Maribellus mangrovi]|uniref:SusC/RagA family TonB-linked outer membrane protein n=1 Tax=Maribellus mangrovi TaxID=3133146 RepID=UPI0030ED12A1